MESRKHPRYPAGVEAVVEHPWLGHRRARIRDVNASGVFVEFPESTDLNPIAANLSRSPITLRYRLPRGPAGRPCIWRGHVARVGEGGLGATTEHARLDGDPSLIRLVDYAQRTQTRRREIEAEAVSRFH